MGSTIPHSLFIDVCRGTTSRQCGDIITYFYEVKNTNHIKRPTSVVLIGQLLDFIVDYSTSAASNEAIT